MIWLILLSLVLAFRKQWLVIFGVGVVFDLYQYQRLGQTSLLLLIISGVVFLVIRYWPMMKIGEVKLRLGL